MIVFCQFTQISPSEVYFNIYHFINRQMFSFSRLPESQWQVILYILHALEQIEEIIRQLESQIQAISKMWKNTGSAPAARDNVSSALNVNVSTPEWENCLIIVLRIPKVYSSVLTQKLQ